MDVREKLIKICFREFCDIAGDSPCGCDGCPYGEYDPDNGGCFDEYKKDKIEKLENDMDKYQKEDNGVTVQEWVPASEPPKKITNKVIVLCKNGYIGFGHYEDYKGKQTWYNLESGKPFTDWDLEDCESYKVTHWMYLPQPPKGE